jgi:FKBP-type peptidyl-prolyl cis-trans isomerase
MSSRIRIPDADFDFLPIPDPGSRGQKGTGSRIRNTFGGPHKYTLNCLCLLQGWDVGVAGLKVGGKRRLTLPPNMAYGAQGAPPDIPPNSTLVFDVECKFVN